MNIQQTSLNPQLMKLEGVYWSQETIGRSVGEMVCLKLHSFQVIQMKLAT